jgi:hypothetical protein
LNKVKTQYRKSHYWFDVRGAYGTLFLTKGARHEDPAPIVQ